MSNKGNVGIDEICTELAQLVSDSDNWGWLLDMVWCLRPELSRPYLDSSRRSCVKRNGKGVVDRAEELQVVEGSDSEALRVRSGLEKSCEIKFEIIFNMQLTHSLID